MLFYEPNRAIAKNPYIPDTGLIDAVNVALLLGQPLLLTGEPGTGKTALAASVADSLGLAEPLKFETKSNSYAKELFYTYDALGRLQASQSGLPADAINFIQYQALGIAILRSNTEEQVKNFLPPYFVHGGQQRSVVLIDEVDKAPRDFPNDILNEIQDMYFRVQELGNATIGAKQAEQLAHPIVIITSNSEKDLPDAFLRRCIYYDIPFPEPDRLIDIINAHLGKFAGGNDAFLDDALDFFHRLRQFDIGLRKIPATSELLSWLAALRGRYQNEKNPLRSIPSALSSTLSCLVKTADDQKRARQVAEAWLKAKI